MKVLLYIADSMRAEYVDYRDMPIIYLASLMLDTMQYFYGFSGMQCRPKGEYGVIGRRKRAGI